MGTTDIALQRMFNQLTRGNAGLAIAEMETFLAAWPNKQTAEKLMGIKEEYHLMEDYWKRGCDDPQREIQYQRLLQRVYALAANIAIHRHTASSAFLANLHASARQQRASWAISEIKHELEDFVSEVAMLQLEPEERRKEKSRELYKNHQQMMNALFNYIVTSRIWTEGVAHDMEQLLTAPTVDSNDQQLLVAAVTLSLMNRFDMAKFRMLANVYRNANDEAVRQRALVGWALSIDDDFIAVYPEQREVVKTMLQNERTCKELTELQMQLVYTLNAENDTATMRDEIMPGLMKNNSFRITKNGIEEIPEDPMDDILHPDESERRIEELEDAIHRMSDMQKRGADIYFGGFSQMKRFPFFYDMSNWLVPFYIEHPDICQFIERIGTGTFLEKALQTGPFCNSDQYSFVIALQNVIDKLPENIRTIMKNGEIMPGGEIMVEDTKTQAYIRRKYLMDLYRFFMLFPNRGALCNPFDTSKNEIGMCLFITSELFSGTPLEQHKREVVTTLRKHKFLKTAATLLASFPEEMRDIQYYLWTEDYMKALEIDANNERALAGAARQHFSGGRFDEAAECYDRLTLIRPEKTAYMLNKAVCMVHMEEYDEALKILYQLSYEHDDQNVRRVMAWTLTCHGRLEQAVGMYEKVMEAEQPLAEDYMNQGYCLWLAGKLEMAAECFRKYSETSGISADADDFFDIDWLKKYGVSDTEIKLMKALVPRG